MKTLQNNYTTIEQSAEILELGIPKETADAVYIVYNKDTSEEYYTLSIPLKHQSSVTEIVEKGNAQYSNGNVSFYYCWSFGRLVEIYCYLTGVKIFKIYTLNAFMDEIIYLLKSIKAIGVNFLKLNKFV